MNTTNDKTWMEKARTRVSCPGRYDGIGTARMVAEYRVFCGIEVGMEITDDMAAKELDLRFNSVFYQDARNRLRELKGFILRRLPRREIPEALRLLEDAENSLKPNFP